MDDVQPSSSLQLFFVERIASPVDCPTPAASGVNMQVLEILRLPGLGSRVAAWLLRAAQHQK